jgi:hypothetical protein
MSEIWIETRHDEPRGCGWRKAGGKYLVGGALCRPCGKLPCKLIRCPCCAHVIKPARGWTWIGAKILFGIGPCGDDGDCWVCETQCVLANPPERAGLLWIGGQFYSCESFAREAARQGISRRIAQIPKDLHVGKTLVLLAHRKVEFAWGEELQPGIFAAFVPKAIEYVVRGDESAAELERLVKQGCTLVHVERRCPDDEIEKTCVEPRVAGSPGVRPAYETGPADGAGDGGGGSGSVCEVPGSPGLGTVDDRTGTAAPADRISI